MKFLHAIEIELLVVALIVGVMWGAIKLVLFMVERSERNRRDDGSADETR